MAAARPWRRARVLAKLGLDPHEQQQLHHTAPDATLHDQLTQAINAQKTWLTGSMPVSVQGRAEEEEDRELGAPVMDSTRERIKWVSGASRRSCARGILRSLSKGGEFGVEVLVVPPRQVSYRLQHDCERGTRHLPDRRRALLAEDEEREERQRHQARDEQHPAAPRLPCRRMLQLWHGSSSATTTHLHVHRSSPLLTKLQWS